jgi:hypothetical protein
LPPTAPPTSRGDAGIRRSVHAAVNPPSVTFPPPVTLPKVRSFKRRFANKGVRSFKGRFANKGCSDADVEPRASRRAFGRAGFDKIWRDFSVVQHASASRHGGAPAAGLAASRHPRRDRQQLHRCSGGLRLPAAPCSAGVPLQAQMLAAWRRPPRGALVGPRCQGRIRSGRPFKAPNGHGGRSRARRPSGEPGLRGVARVDLCIARENHCRIFVRNLRNVHAVNTRGAASRFQNAPSL